MGVFYKEVSPEITKNRDPCPALTQKFSINLINWMLVMPRNQVIWLAVLIIFESPIVFESPYFSCCNVFETHSFTG